MADRRIAPDGGPEVHPNWHAKGVKRVPTFLVERKNPDTGRLRHERIREKDFDPKIHTKLDEEQVARRHRGRVRLVEHQENFGTESRQELATMTLDVLRSKPEWRSVPDRASIKKKDDVITAILDIRKSLTRV